ncbi:MAG: hypothetical protein PHX89_09160, partial [bacterium]|nr:hypothetical protein [bacterium]
PETGYVMTTLRIGQEKGLATERIAELAAHGKKIVLQLFWGPGGRYNWSYHSLVAIPFEKEVRADLFAGIDKTIEAVCSENIYAVHLLEEMGWFGIDICHAGDWHLNKYGILSGAQDCTLYAIWKASKDCKWSPAAPNIARQNATFQRMTGLDMKSSSSWDFEERYIFDRWCRQVSAMAEMAFFEHIKNKYPGIKCFTWHVIRQEQNPLKSSEASLMATCIDGAVFNPYSSLLSCYYGSFGPALTLYPNKEIIGVMWGGFDSKNYRHARMTMAYLSGSKGLGFWEGNKTIRGEGDGAYSDLYPWPAGGQAMDYKVPEIWKLNTAIFKKLSHLPRFDRSHSRILLLGEPEGGPHTIINAFSGYKSIDIVPPGYEQMIRLLDYDLVIGHLNSFSDYNYWQNKYGMPGPGLDMRKTEEYVKNGGLLLLSGGAISQDGKLFLNKYLFSTKKFQDIELRYKPEPVLGKKLNLEASYALELLQRTVKVTKAENIQGDQFGYLISHGKGYVYYFPLYRNRREKNEQSLQDYRTLLRDLSRGLLELAGKKSVADKFVCPKGYDFMEVENKSGSIKCYIWFGGPEFQVKGRDVLSGDKDPVFGPARRGGIVVRE